MTNEEPRPVLLWRIEAAKQQGLWNVDQAAIACRIAELPFYAACALLQKESNGKNVWGNDKKVDENGDVTEWAVFSGYTRLVSRESYNLFKHEVINHGKLSNGVGPCQITWAGTVQSDGTRDGGMFKDMEDRGLRPYVVGDNMQYGFELMAWLRSVEGSWERAGTRYNGSPIYGLDFQKKVRWWHSLLNINGPMPA